MKATPTVCTMVVAVLLSCAGCTQDEVTARPQDPPSHLVLKDVARDLASGDGRQEFSSWANVDLVGADLRRTADGFTIEVEYRDIRPRANPSWGVAFGLGSEQNSFEYDVSWEESRFADTAEWQRSLNVQGITSEDAGIGRPCRGSKAKIDFQTNILSITIPARCVDRFQPLLVRRLSSHAAVDTRRYQGSAEDTFVRAEDENIFVLASP